MPTRKLLRATKQDPGSYLNCEPGPPFFFLICQTPSTGHKALEFFCSCGKVNCNALDREPRVRWPRGIWFPEFSALSGCTFLHGSRTGNAISSGRLADLRNHASSICSDTLAWRNFCLAFYFSWFPAMLLTNSTDEAILVLCYCGYVLCSTLLLTVALRAGKSVALIYCILVFIGVVRSFNTPSRPRHSSTACARAPFSQRSCVDLQRLPGGHNSWPRCWRGCVRGISRPGLRIRGVRDSSKRRRAVHHANQNHCKNKKPGAVESRVDARGVQVYLAAEINFGIDFVGPLCGAAWRCCRTTSGLCA